MRDHLCPVRFKLLAVLAVAIGFFSSIAPPSVFGSFVQAQEAESEATAETSPTRLDETWIDSTDLPGVLILAGGGPLPEQVPETLYRLAGAKEARLVVIPTADNESDAPDASPERWLAPWSKLEFASLTLQTIAADQPPTAEQRETLAQATAIWFTGGQQSRLAQRILGTPWESLILDVFQRGGVIGGTSAGAAVQCRHMIAGGDTQPQMETGLDLLGGAIIDQHFLARNRQARLTKAVTDHPACYGLGIDEATAVVIAGRQLQVIGKSSVTVVLGTDPAGRSETFQLQPGDSADLIALRRSRQHRALGDWPTRSPQTPVVDKGSLLICGGGRLGEELVTCFVEKAGGKDAVIVVLPTAQPDPLPAQSGIAQLFLRNGAGRVEVLPQRVRDEVESREFIETLQQATAVWFGGGRQWRFVDAYADTKAEEAIADVLNRGGIIGGSSAGASIQGDYLARGNPLGNLEIMSEGYERGFGYLPGVAIDQHFTQRDRMSDLQSLVTTFPQFLGIGLDEGTGILVEGKQAQVIGDHSAFFLKARPQDGDMPEDPVQVIKVNQGDTIRLDSLDVTRGVAQDKRVEVESPEEVITGVETSKPGERAKDPTEDPDQ